MEGSPYAIECLNMTKAYPQPKGYRDVLLHPFTKRTQLALRDVDLKIGRGELVAILGLNGAGKTTLLKLLATLILPTSGTARVNGYDICRESEKVKSQVAFVFSEERSFYWWLTGRENLSFFAALYNLFGAPMRARVEEVLKTVRLREVADGAFMRYSTGMKQRLSIARALLPDPAVLLMDEPTKGLDPLIGSEIRAFIREELVQRRGKTVLFATHHLEEAQEIADWMVVLVRGTVRASGTLEELGGALRLEGTYTLVVDHLSQSAMDRMAELGSVNMPPGLRRNDEDGRVEIRFTPFGTRVDVHRVVDIVAETGGDLVAWYPSRPSLKEVLVHLTKPVG